MMFPLSKRKGVALPILKPRLSPSHQSTRDNKLRQFSLRLLHRIFTTKKELVKYRLASDETCIFCPNSDSIEHTFIDCTVTSFYSEALLWFNRVSNTDVGLSNKQITFNDIPDLKQLTD